MRISALVSSKRLRPKRVDAQLLAATVAAEDACHAACYAQELKNLKRETWSAQQPLRAP